MVTWGPLWDIYVPERNLREQRIPPDFQHFSPLLKIQLRRILLVQALFLQQSHNIGSMCIGDDCFWPSVSTTEVISTTKFGVVSPIFSICYCLNFLK